MILTPESLIATLTEEAQKHDLVALVMFHGCFQEQGLIFSDDPDPLRTLELVLRQEGNKPLGFIGITSDRDDRKHISTWTLQTTEEERMAFDPWPDLSRAIPLFIEEYFGVHRRDSTEERLRQAGFVDMYFPSASTTRARP